MAGWGKTKTNGQVVDELREVNVSIINLRVCVEKWNGLPEKVFCAGGYNTNYGFCWVCPFKQKVNWFPVQKCYKYINFAFSPHRVILVVLWCATDSL